MELGRWERLFEDLEAEVAAESTRERDDEIAEMARIERLQVPLLRRLRAAVGRPLSVWVDHTRFDGLLDEVGGDWLLLTSRQEEVAISLSAVEGVEGLSAASLPEGADPVGERLMWRNLLSRWSRDGGELDLQLGNGMRLRGRVLRVWADHIDVAMEQPTGDASIRPAVRCLASSAVLVVRRSS